MPEFNGDRNLVYSDQEVRSLEGQRLYDADYAYIVMGDRYGDRAVLHVYANRDAVISDIRDLANLHADDDIISVEEKANYFEVTYTSHECINAECDHIAEEGDECPTPKVDTETVWLESATLYSL